MKTKKTLSFFMALVMLVSAILCVNFSVFAATTYNFDSTTGTLTVGGSGAMDDFTESTLSTRQWDSISSNVTSVVVEEGITKIGDYAFCRMPNLTSVSIPNSVTELGKAAFAANDSLLNITVPDSVTVVGDGAFGYMSDSSISNDFVAYCGIKSATQKYCLKNYVPFDSPIIDGAATGVVTTGGEILLWSFVAPNDGVLTFYSTGTKDTYGCLYDAEDYVYYDKTSDFKKKSPKKKDDDGGTNANFKLTYTVEKGHRYYLGASYMLSNVYAGSDEWENGVINVFTTFEPTASPTEHNYVPTVDGYITTFKCDSCDDSYVVDKTALAAAVTTANAVKAENDYNAKYQATSKQTFENALVQVSNAIGVLIETQAEVDEFTSSLQSAQTNLQLQQNRITVKVVNAETYDVIESQNMDVTYGDTFEYAYAIPNGEGKYADLPAYIFYKWTKGDTKLTSIDTSIEDVARGDATYHLYLLPFKATQEDVSSIQTRVRYLDKSNKTVDVRYTESGVAITSNSFAVTAPEVPFYAFAGWELVFGDETNPGDREVVYKATYVYNESNANKCDIIAFDQSEVKVNGVNQVKVGYDTKVELTGASKYAYCDENGNILSAINGNTIYAPHKNVVYITKVDVEQSISTLVTGNFITDNGAYKTLTVNAQYYIPDGTDADECGILVSKNGVNWTKVKSSLQGENHEYSIAMNYSIPGELYVKSYVTVGENTVESAQVTITLE